MMGVSKATRQHRGACFARVMPLDAASKKVSSSELNSGMLQHRLQVGWNSDRRAGGGLALAGESGSTEARSCGDCEDGMSS